MKMEFGNGKGPMKFTNQFSITLYDKSPRGRFSLLFYSREKLWQLAKASPSQ